MQKENKPTDEQLKELYQAAADFKQEQPWKWLYDSDLICVENPKDKTLGYCSVMGRAGEHYALGVYLGHEGLFGFHQLMEHADSMPHHQLQHYQDCLMCSFEDRELLTNEDRKQIKDLGFSFRGRNSWPMFRRYEPGYNPWFINEEECIFLTHALRQTLFVAENVRTNQLGMDMEQGKTILRYSEEKDGKLKWHSQEAQLTIPAISYQPLIITDDLLIQKIKNAGSMGNVSLQADICYLPSAVQEKRQDRPYFPRIFILVEQQSGMVLDIEMYDNAGDDANVVLNKLIHICLGKGVPKEIQVRGEAMAAMLEDFCKKTGIKLKRVKRLPGIDQMIEEMAYQF